jgi:hypothetical protein
MRKNDDNNMYRAQKMEERVSKFRFVPEWEEKLEEAIEYTVL